MIGIVVVGRPANVRLMAGWPTALAAMSPRAEFGIRISKGRVTSVSPAESRWNMSFSNGTVPPSKRLSVEQMTLPTGSMMAHPR